MSWIIIFLICFIILLAIIVIIIIFLSKRSSVENMPYKPYSLDRRVGGSRRGGGKAYTSWRPPVSRTRVDESGGDMILHNYRPVVEPYNPEPDDQAEHTQQSWNIDPYGNLTLSIPMAELVRKYAKPSRRSGIQYIALR